METIVEERQLPRDLVAEEAVLGSILFDSNVFLDLGTITPQDFYGVRNRLIFTAMGDLINRNETIDLITLRAELDKQNQLDNVGGLDYLLELSKKTPTAANAQYYADIVVEKSILRRLINSANNIISKSVDDTQSMEEIIEFAEKEIFSISENKSRDGFIRISDILSTTVENLEILAKQKGDVTGVPTGYPELDRMTTGLHEDELIILAARPAVGKTAFVLNIAQNVAVKEKGTVAIFSLEMGAESLVNRMICAQGSIDAHNMRTGNLTNDEWDKLFFAMETLANTNTYIDDTPGIKISEIRAKCRRLAQEKGSIDLVVIDYLQLIESAGRSRENRQQEVSEISRQLKKLAKELKAPIIALSQLSRGVEQRQDKRPVLSDIRESGSIEQDADIVAFLYRDDYYQREGSDKKDKTDQKDTVEEQPIENNIVEVIIEKNRSGARGTVKLLFKKEYNKFSPIALEQSPQ
ncbi:replicative DNA helicase [Carnobacteriaceae bacterium zg-ZUI252]|nr:replicative DNA helicase [Carnobacteriaceae bacterium zg-ZUI252]